MSGGDLEAIGPDDAGLADVADDLEAIHVEWDGSYALVEWRGRRDAVAPIRVVLSAVREWRSDMNGAAFEYELLERIGDGGSRFDTLEDYRDHLTRRAVRRLDEAVDPFRGADPSDYTEGVRLVRWP